ncbi:MAG: DUF4249 domain-containing protein [Gemmatimonadales bacterium]|nr:DUF4249 domain-containing protein [Gemmatimonadales bacterium]
MPRLDSPFRLLALLALLALPGCTRVVELDLPEGPRRLVVDARIELRNWGNPGEQRIVLTTTDAVTGVGATPAATGAVVRVEGQPGESYLFTERQRGSGEYLHGSFTPVVGRRYTLLIDYQGDRYRATSTLLPVAPIEELYFVYQEASLGSEAGYRATIDYADPPGVNNFYFWELSVDGRRRAQIDPGTRFRILSADRFYDGGRIVGYTPFDEEVLLPGQHVQIRQVALSEDAYRYYFVLLEQMTGGGNPFAAPPVSVRGNVVNLTTPSRVPLGYFLAAESFGASAVVPPPIR